MLYQLGIILIIVIAALTVAKRLGGDKKDNIIFEYEMDDQD